MRELFIWLLLFTKISKQPQTSNKEIKETFLKHYPKYKEYTQIVSLKIGAYLKDIYPNLLQIEGGGSLQML